MCIAKTTLLSSMLAFVSATLAIEVTFNGEEKKNERR
jgi:hypothetical protein